MVPSQIFPVKLVFGVKIKLAAILTGSKYHLTESTQNWYPLAKLIAATEKIRFWAFSRAYGRRNFSQSPLWARNRSSFAIQHPIRSFYDHGSHATSSLGRFSLALQVGRFLAPRPTRLQRQGKAPWGRGWSPWGDQSRGELFYHRSKKKVTKNVLSARFNLKKAIKTHSTKYLSSTHYELITKVYLEKKERRKARKKTEKKREIKTVQSLPVFVAGLGEGLSKTCQTLDASWRL